MIKRVRREEEKKMKKEMLNEIFSKYGIRLIEEVGKEVFLIDYLKEPGEKQVLKVIDIAERAKQEANEKYSEETVKKLFGIIHGNELIWNEKITLTQCEYMVRILEDYIIGGADEEIFLYAIRMPYYRTLSLVCEKDGMDENKIIGMGIDICNALRTLHHNGTKEFYQNETVRFGTSLHLDIKPDNIYLEEKDGQKTFMLGDFGTVIEKGTRALPMRSKGFYAPEMEEFNRLPTEAADIFMLGMVLYWCVCDKKEAAEDFWKTRFLNKEVSIPANCSPHLWKVIEKATRTEAEQRYQSATEMLSALQRVNVNKTIVAEVMKENYESKSTFDSVVKLIEAGILISHFLKKIKKTFI